MSHAPNHLPMQLRSQHRMREYLLHICALIRLLLEHAPNQRTQTGAIMLRQRCGILTDDSHHQNRDVTADKRPLQCAELVCDHAERPDVAGRAVGAPVADLRGEVVRGADLRPEG